MQKLKHEIFFILFLYFAEITKILEILHDMQLFTILP